MDTLSMTTLEPGQVYKSVACSDTDLSDHDLSECVFEQCSFDGVEFRRANLTGAQFNQCEFNDSASENQANFTHANLREAHFERCNLTLANFTGVKAYGAVFLRCQMQGVDFSRADFRLPVGNTDLVDLSITECNLSFANLGHNYLQAAVLENNRMLEVCLDYCDLTNANLQGSTLHGISSVGVTLAGADLRGAEFSQLDPRSVDLTGVKIFPDQAWGLLDALGVIVETD